MWPIGEALPNHLHIDDFHWLFRPSAVTMGALVLLANRLGERGQSGGIEWPKGAGVGKWDMHNGLNLRRRLASLRLVAGSEQERL